MTSPFGMKLLEQDHDLAFTFDAEGAPGKLRPRAFSASESLFGCYTLRVELVSPDADIDLSAVVDLGARLTIHDRYQGKRHFHGIVTEAETGDTGFRTTAYSMTIRPGLARLMHVSDSRIFQGVTVPDIVAQVLEEHGVVDTEWRLVGTHLPREYCVQYNERTYDFLCRLLAEEGIAFWFEHGEGSHRLVLSDAPLSLSPLSAAPSLTYNATAGGDGKGLAVVRRFVLRNRLASTAFHQKDYTFRQPSYGQDHLDAMKESAGEKATYQLYDYPGRYKGPGAGKPFTEHKLEAQRVGAITGEGVTNSIHLCPGFSFAMTDHPNGKANIDHRLLSVQHHGVQDPALEQEASPDGRTAYSASFTTQPARLPYRPTNPNPKPRVLGSQIATVVGPAGEEIYCDEYGRIKVQFPWDRYGASDESSSCWIRVAQSSGGGTWGHVSVPRIGNEVVVDFLEGDPDQPVVLGMTFNAANMPPYKLPGHKTKMALRSQTHKGAGHSEISFEDEAGREDLFVHAQKDHTIKVLNNQNANIRSNRVENVGANASTAIAANMMERVGANKHVTVGGSGLGLLQMLMPLVMAGGKFFRKGAQKAGAGGVVKYAGDVAGVADLPKELAAILMTGDFGGTGGHRGEAGAAQHGAAAGMASLMDLIMPSSGTMSTTVEKFKKETVGEASTEQVGIAKNTLVGSVFTTSVGKLMKTKVGEDIDVEAKQSIFARTKKHTLQAKDKFIIGGPGGTIIIDKSGITIKAKTVKIKSPSVDFSSGSPDQVDALKSDKPFVQECKGK